MTEHEIALARRAVAAPGWRWLPGMAAIGRNGAKWRLYMGSGGVLCAQGEGDAGGYCAGWSSEWAEILGALPNLADDLTALGLLALVRERWGPDVYLVQVKAYNGRDRRWTLARGTSPTLLVGMNADSVLCYVSAETEVEALVVALEVTP